MEAIKFSLTQVFVDSFLDYDQAAPEKKTPNMDNPVWVSIIFAAQTQQPLPAQATVNQPNPAPVIAEPLTTDQAHRHDQPRNALTQPPHLTAQLRKTSEESD